MDRLRRLDAFTKYDSAFVKRTTTGGILSCFTVRRIYILHLATPRTTFYVPFLVLT